jgi:DNA helicase HerA-like ATPase
MTLGWDGLSGLGAYRITEIPRQSSATADTSDVTDVGRRQRIAALAAAYHMTASTASTASTGSTTPGRENGHAALAFGWIRHCAGGPVQLVAAGDAIVGDESENEAFLMLPPGATAQPLKPGTLAKLMSQLASWRAITGIPDGLITTQADPRRQPPSLEESLLEVWPRPFGYMVFVEALSEAEVQQAAEDVAHRERLATGDADRFPERAVAARRLNLRHTEIRKGLSTGFWRVRIMAGGADPAAAARVAGLVCAATDLTELPYTLAPASEPSKPLSELMEQEKDEFLASTDLLAVLTRPPGKEIPGIRLALKPDFDVTQESAGTREAIALGEVLDRTSRAAGPLVLPKDSLNRHVFVTGATGSGKSQTIRALLEAATRAHIPWLVVEPAKAEYRLMAARLKGTAEVIRIRPGESDGIAAGLNPLEPARDEEGRRFPLQTHADLIKALFIASFRSEEPFPQVLSAALSRVYEEAGWDLALSETMTGDSNPSYPTLTDLQRTAERVVNEVGYSQRITDDVLGFIRVRLASLRLGTTGRFLEGGHQLDFSKLLITNVVLEIEDVGDDRDKAFLMGTVLIRLTEHLRLAHQATPDGLLRHLTVIEEAHRLLRHPEPGSADSASGSAANHAVEMFAGMLAEVRAYGEGLVIAEQIPGRLIPDVIKNTSVKIAHRLPAADDRAVVGATMNMTDAQSRYLVTLRPGEAAVFADGMDFPLLARMPDGSVREAGVSAETSTPASIVQPRSITCGADCVGRPCTLRDMRVAQRALDEYPGIRLWTELSVLAHLTGWPMPVPKTTLLSLLQMMPARLRDCAISHGVDLAVNSRSGVIAGRVSPVGLASHVSTAIRARVSRGNWLCQREESRWLAPAYKWTLVLDALKSMDRKTPGAGPHPRSAEWERMYGQVITGDTCARQVGTVQRWYDGAQRDSWEVRTVAFGVDAPSAIERAVGAIAEDDDFEERLTGYLEQFIDCRWPRLYLTADIGLCTVPAMRACRSHLCTGCSRSYPHGYPQLCELRCQWQFGSCDVALSIIHSFRLWITLHAHPDQRDRGQREDRRCDPFAVGREVQGVQPRRQVTRGHRHRDRVRGGAGQQPDQHHPVQQRRGIQGEQADRHHVVPRPLERGDEQPGQAQPERGCERGKPRCAIGQPEQRQHRDRGEQQVGDQDQVRGHAVGTEPFRPAEHRPPEQLVHRVRGDAVAAGEEHLDGRGASQRVRGDRHHGETGGGRRECGQRPAAGPGNGEAEQRVLHLDTRRDGYQQAGDQCSGRGQVLPQREDRGQAEHGGQPVNVPGGHDFPQQQRVRRPQQVCPQPHAGITAHGRITAEHAVEQQRHRHKAGGFEQLEPERDVAERRAAELGGHPLGGGGDRAVDGRSVIPQGGDRADLVADRVAAVLKLVRGHHVRAVPKHRYPAARRVGQRVRGPSRRQDGEHDHSEETEA